MPYQVLCAGDPKVMVDGGGERTLVVVEDGNAMRFWASTSDLEAVLRGDPLQLSAYGGFCRFERAGEEVRMEFGLTDRARKRCAFPAAAMADALIWVRSLAESFDGV